MPARPHSPNRESIAQQVKKEQCGHDCGCGTAQDTCFIGCGATKVSETQCVANCPNVKEVEPKKEVDAKK